MQQVEHLVDTLHLEDLRNPLHPSMFDENEKMNRLIFLLTIISAIFLPLNLIVGFFGMNTSGLPFTEGANGTLSVVAGLVFLVVTTSLGVLLWRREIEYSE